ncbi:MAG: hypothetical protein HOH81_05755 [Flavobacteriaceae bacterium]|jgi:hypothetical protein|nr:hypothetical protein [Flavobacteriaceae bacterium]
MKATPILFLWWTLFSIPIAVQNKPQFTPYSPETSLIKLQKDYPFIKSIAPLDTALYSTEKDIVYKTLNQTVLQLDIYAPKIKKTLYSPPFYWFMEAGGLQEVVSINNAWQKPNK